MKKQNKWVTFWNDEAGDFGIKQIAVTVAVIVVIGFVVTAMRTNMGTWVGEVWDMFMEQIEGMM